MLFSVGSEGDGAEIAASEAPPPVCWARNSSSSFQETPVYIYIPGKCPQPQTPVHRGQLSSAASGTNCPELSVKCAGLVLWTIVKPMGVWNQSWWEYPHLKNQHMPCSKALPLSYSGFISIISMVTCGQGQRWQQPGLRTLASQKKGHLKGLGQGPEAGSGCLAKWEEDWRGFIWKRSK